MLKLKQGVALVAVGSVAFVAGRALPTWGAAAAAPPDKVTEKTKEMKERVKDGSPPTEQMEKMAKMMEPGADHRVMEPLIGRFEGSGKMWMEEGAEPMEFSGSVEREWILNGRFVHEKVTGEPMGPEQPAFEGLGVIGYNTVERRYETAWIENMATYISTMNGTYDATKKVFTFTGEMLNPMTLKRTKQRTMLDVSDPDREVMTGYATDTSGKEFKCFEGVFERK